MRLISSGVSLCCLNTPRYGTLLCAYSRLLLTARTAHNDLPQSRPERGSLLSRSSCSLDDPVGQATEINWTDTNRGNPDGLRSWWWSYISVCWFPFFASCVNPQNNNHGNPADLTSWRWWYTSVLLLSILFLVLNWLEILTPLFSYHCLLCLLCFHSSPVRRSGPVNISLRLTAWESVHYWK